MKLSESTNTPVVKALILGDSASGKTATLASLASAGYQLKIHDWDNGHQILLDPKVLEPRYRKNIEVKVLTDKLRGSRTGVVYSTPKAFTIGLQSLDSWDDGPGISSWGPETVYVCDSLTFMGEAAMRYTLYMNGRLGQQPYQSDWGEAMKRQEEYLMLLYSDYVKCHVIINCHVKIQEVPGLETKKDEKGRTTEEGLIKFYPMALGRQLPPKLGRYFNNVFHCGASGSGANVRRRVHTTTWREFDMLKNERPSLLDLEYPQSDGLAKIFSVLTHTEAQKATNNSE